MQLNTITNQAIALAGIAQSAALVQQLATTGSADNAAMKASIASVLKIDADDVLDVYGGLSGIKLGLEQLNAQMTGYKITHPEQARYSASLVFLENQLAGKTKLLSTLQIGISKAQAQSEYFGLLHENVLANLGDIYSNTISTLQPRIMVNGDPELLTRPEIANMIRACLLAGIRSAMLWRQCGGKRWKFLLYRKKIRTELQALIKQI
ncbi:MAG: high frequency lysogenization protein HflD [Methylovulum sp.]|jgi:high frequency lysogenization protein|nr:high frequency lysogenization protein HflD [Methylovulum sp.]MCF7998329.1 high frequency lysogenization protein HflD [Methylovulum sp.]